MKPQPIQGASLALLALIVALAAAMWLVLRASAPPNAAPAAPVPLTFAPTVVPPGAPAGAPVPTAAGTTPESFYATQGAGQQATIATTALGTPFCRRVASDFGAAMITPYLIDVNTMRGNCKLGPRDSTDVDNRSSSHGTQCTSLLYLRVI